MTVFQLRRDHRCGSNSVDIILLFETVEQANEAAHAFMSKMEGNWSRQGLINGWQDLDASHHFLWIDEVHVHGNGIRPQTAANMLSR